MKSYIHDNDDKYTKKCETNDCPNEVLIGVSRQYCAKCLGGDPYEFECKLIPEFNQRWVM